MQKRLQDESYKSGKRVLLNGNQAVAEAVKIAKPDVIAAYPITPQTPVVEKLAEFVAKGELDSEFVNVESEYSALSVVFGAALTGARVFTATSSHGLAYMYEMCWWVAGSRVPLVMALPTRSIGAPWNIHSDHSDVMILKDVGWIISMAENAQECFDLTLIGFPISEELNIPYSVSYDAFIISHTAEVVEVREVELPKRKQAYKILPNSEFAFNAVTINDARHKARKTLMKDLENSRGKIEKIGRSFLGEEFSLAEKYKVEDADYVVVTYGGWSGDFKDVVDEMREEGVKIGLLRLRFLRPLPEEELKEISGDVLVVDRSALYKFGGMGGEVKRIIPEAKNVIAALGGYEISYSEIKALVRKFVSGKIGEVEWYP
ncbi:pyruvate flavodoxin/ferredoxin oxidoreductase domain protein [Ferroglobus placidus DSM 10642]|uniref:Pyruvate flavodoxin/ferredoxin oxidoreductase domain protein n=1 Tax=Ferroglobus placidus (strain DSM 10642 / AEDII12DO) TaxID=589924 RepID=D3RZQ4_FERPA|nr:pyruvate ferredoxin oxidoreductase [Ferroglobus placidus]ADC65967.1 pyruvate flavodoxin/ferredoxin oxidoreductase domain protein [Ferroglobus placidus DSM 10642]